MDAPLQPSGPRTGPLIDFRLRSLEKELNEAEKNGTDLTEAQHERIKEVFTVYSQSSAVKRKVFDAQYPKSAQQFAGLIKHKLL